MNDVHDAKTLSVRRSVWQLVARVRREALGALDRALASDPELAELEVTEAQYAIVATLAEQQSSSAAQLCKWFSYDAGAMTRLVDRLETKGLVQRHRCAHDRRQISLELTDSGKAFFPKMKAVAVRVENDALRGLTREDVWNLQKYLTRFLENL